MAISLMLMKKWRRWRNIMGNDNTVDKILLREMFNKIRNAEISNIKTQAKDDNHMVSAIEKFVCKKVEGEMKK